jgi:hypothetical protein
VVLSAFFFVVLVGLGIARVAGAVASEAGIGWPVVLGGVCWGTAFWVIFRGFLR